MNRKVKHSVLSVLSVGIVAGLVVGCGSTGSANNSTQSKNTTGSASTKPQQLVLYSAQGYDSAMAKAFQAKTGIKVKLVDDSTGNIVAKAEAEKSNPHWDVIWFDGPSTMQSLDNQGMLLQNWTPSDMSNYTSLGKKLVPSDDAYFPGGITAAVAMAYNTKLVKPSQAPKDYQDLLKSQYKGAFGMNNPSISGPAFPFVAGIMQQKGLQQGEQFFTDLKKNGMHIYPTNGNTLKALLAGQIKVAMIQDSALISAKLKGDPINIVYPSSGAFTLPDVMGIDKNAPDMAAAKQFVEFVLSQQGQKVMVNPKNGGGDSYYNPVIKGISPNSARQQSGINWVAVNPVKAAQDENQVKKWFNENITQ